MSSWEKCCSSLAIGLIQVQQFRNAGLGETLRTRSDRIGGYLLSRREYGHLTRTSGSVYWRVAMLVDAVAGDQCKTCFLETGGRHDPVIYALLPVNVAVVISPSATRGRR